MKYIRLHNYAIKYIMSNLSWPIVSDRCDLLNMRDPEGIACRSEKQHVPFRSRRFSDKSTLFGNILRRTYLNINSRQIHLLDKALILWSVKIFSDSPMRSLMNWDSPWEILEELHAEVKSNTCYSAQGDNVINPRSSKIFYIGYTWISLWDKSICQKWHWYYDMSKYSQIPQW